MKHDILQVKKKVIINKKFKKLKPPILLPPFLGVINGNVKTGKSNLLVNLIYNDAFYKDVFDKIIFISPTLNNDDTLISVRDDEDIIKISNNLDDMDEILKDIVEVKEEDEDNAKEYYLIILDDCLGYIKPKSYLTYLCTKYRHYKISLLITSQNFRSIPNIIRNNATFYLLYKSYNHREKSKYIDEFAGAFPDFEKYYNYATSKDYNFLYIDLRNMKLYHNFTKLLS